MQNDIKNIVFLVPYRHMRIGVSKKDRLENNTPHKWDDFFILLYCEILNQFRL